MKGNAGKIKPVFLKLLLYKDVRLISFCIIKKTLLIFWLIFTRIYSRSIIKQILENGNDLYIPRVKSIKIGLLGE